MRPIAALLAFALLGAAAPAPEAPLPVHVGGRTIVDADGSRMFGWPGTYFESRFNGSGVEVRFDAPAEYMRLLIDGEERAVFKRPGRIATTIGGLAGGDHVVRLEKLTESQQGGGRFIGFFAADGATPLTPMPRARQIEFIGDSYTVGYGDMSPVTKCTETEVHDTTNTQVAFGPMVAKHFDADYRINAYSGFGIVRNYNGSSAGSNLPAIYPRLKPDDDAHRDPAVADWHPGVIVINLGTNDFSTPLHAGERWADPDALHADYRASYVSFVRDVMKRQPQARLILMGSEDFYADVEKVAATLKSPGRVTTLEFTGLDHQACNSHPSLADHRMIAAKLEEVIAGVSGF